MITEIKTNLSKYLGKEAKIKYNLGRKKHESYNAKLINLYDNVFVVELDSNEKKSFTYADIITKTIKIDFDN